jgi:hypothetical protein
MGHEEAHLRRREKLTRTLPCSFGKLPEQELICPPEEIRLHIREAETITGIGERLDDASQFRRVDVRLTVSLRCEINDVDHAGE